MTVDFETNGNELILVYTPERGSEEIKNRLISEDGVLIKKTFFVNQILLREFDDDFDYEEILRFCIGTVGEHYTHLDSEVFRTKHSFYFANEIKLNYKMFIAHRDIAILRKIDEVIEHAFYIGGDWEAHNGISKETFENLISKFPKTAELDKYAHKRIASIIKDYFPECDKYEAIYEKFIGSKSKSFAPTTSTVSKFNIQIELEQFSVAYQELNDMIDRYEAIDEKQWQEKIHNILQLLYPKYICCAREIKFYGGKNDKQPDFLLVDANGFLDILEIKKADVRVLTQYRNNYVAAREISGAIQQIEKYIFCLNSSNKAQEDVSKKLIEFLPDSIEVKFVNPQGILIAGRSNNFDREQLRDFELIKRQYKHVADIMTYDDLAQRLSNIIAALEKRL